VLPLTIFLSFLFFFYLLVNYCLVEPGGVKTNYATTSVKFIPKLPAYEGDDMPANVLLRYIDNPTSQDMWAPPASIAACMYELVSRGQVIPLRQPLGPDAWMTIKAELPKTEKLLDEGKELAMRAGHSEQANWEKFM
jgi:hypothetical protein